MQDTDGNRITAGYTAGQLTSLTASSGQYIHIGYNAAGSDLVHHRLGRPDHDYNYDPTNTYLVSVNGFNGQTTNYTYDTTSGDRGPERPRRRSPSPAARTSISPTTAWAD